MKNITGQSGLTLVELMIAISILGIITAVGSTILLQHLPTMRLKSATRDLFSTMMQAKVEAIRRGASVSIAFNTAGNSYTMFLDNGAGGGIASNGIIDGTETSLQAATVLPSNVTFNGATTFGNNALVFSQRGIPIPATTPPGLVPGIVNLRAVNTVRLRSITVSTAGNIRIDTN
jgi:type IV fimbrial biogenesis protein FimT